MTTAMETRPAPGGKDMRTELAAGELAQNRNGDASLNKGLMTIGALSDQCGLTVRTLRYYEEMGLIQPAKRTESRYRLYHPRALKRVKAIVALQDLNYSLEQIAEVLGPSVSADEEMTKSTRIENSKAYLQKQLACIQEKMVALEKLEQDIQQRCFVLEESCMPCAQVNNCDDCLDDCEHREVHLD